LLYALLTLYRVLRPFEISFVQAFGRELHDARAWCNTYRRTGEVGDLNQAWDLYYTVFRKIARQLPS
jgi:FKBP12-rapamycin complex-associated protein